MTAVNKVLNVVLACEIRGRLRVQRSKYRISAADSAGLSFAARSRGCRGIVVKREIIAAAPLWDCSPAMLTGHAGTCAATSIHHGFARRMRFFFPFAPLMGRQCESSGGCCLIRRSARRVARFPVNRKGWRARKARSKAMKIRRCAISAQIAAISRTGHAPEVDLSRRGWHERATHLLARVL